MRKGFIFLLAVLISIIPAVSATPLIQITDNGTGSFELYSPSAEIVKEPKGIDGFGYLIKTGESDIKLTTQLGNIYIAADSDFLFAGGSPISLFLINGKANIILNDDLIDPIYIYTPTTKATINKNGEYAFISTEDEESFYNFSGSETAVYDGITGRSIAVGSMESIDYLNHETAEEITEEKYHALSVLDSILFRASVPNAPAVAFISSLISDTPAKPELFIKDSILKENIPAAPSLSIVRTDIIAKAPLKPAFSITSASTLKRKAVPDSMSISADTALLSLPVLIKGEFSSPSDTILQIAEPDNDEEAETVSQEIRSTIIPDTISTEQEKSQETSAPNQISGKATKNFSFDMLFSTRAYTDSETQEQALAFSFQPLFRYGSFALTLNLDPVHILSYADNKSTLDWLSYSISFLESLKYRSLDEHFSIVIDRYTDIDGDSVGLYSGVNHINDGKNERLSMSLELDYPFFGMRVYSNDLLLNRYRKFVNGIDIDFSFSRDLPVGITIGLLSSSDITDYLKSLTLYPEFAFYLPFYTKGSSYVGLKVGMSLALKPSEIKDYSIAKNGYLISGVLPMKFGAFTAEPGIHYTNGPLHYNSVDSSDYTPITIDDTSILTLASKMSFDGKYIGGKANILFDIALNNMTAIKENSFLDASLFLRFNDFRISGGMTVQNFTSAESFQNSNSKIYGGIDFTFPGVTTYIKAGITDLKDRKFFLTYGASASFFSSDISARESKEKDKNFPVHFDIITGYKYRFSSDKASYLINPVIRFGMDSYYISLRAPIQLSFNESREFVFEGQNGKKWWDFGASETDSSRKLFRAITDSISLIDGMRLGEEHNIAYLIAERGWRKNGSLFTAFGYDNILTLRSGFNFANLSLGLFVDDLENPHIGEFSIGILPVGQDSISIGIRVPGEVLFADLKNFDMNFYPEFRIDLPFLKNHLRMSILAIGNIGVEYNDGIPTNTSVIYDFTNSRFSSAIAGGEITIGFPNIDFSVQGGYRIGNLTPDMYNRFTSFYNEIPTPTSRLASTTVSSPDGYYGKISSDIKFSRFRLELAYSVANIVNLCTDFRTANDVFSAKMDIYFNEALSFYASFDRRGFARLFAAEEDFLTVMKDKNTLFALGIDFNYGMLNLNAEFATALNSNGYSPANPYINTNPVYIGPTTTSLAVTTRIHF